MSPLAHDIAHKQREADRLPSVEDWIAAGNVPVRRETPPRPSHCMTSHKPRSQK